MFQTIWDTILYKPLLNALAFLVSVIPGGDIGIAVIVLTVFVKMALFPLSQKSIESQNKMNKLAPHLKNIKESGASKEEQAKKTFELYKEHKTNPFSGCILLLVQIPIIFALYFVFLKGIKLDSGLLYSFIHVPENVSMMFLGLIDMSKGSIVLAVLAGISQFFQAYFMPKPAEQPEQKAGSFQESFGKSMQLQMKYVFPLVITVIAYRVSGAVALYWIVNNLFTIGQQLYAMKKEKSISVTQ